MKIVGVNAALARLIAAIFSGSYKMEAARLDRARARSALDALSLRRMHLDRKNGVLAGLELLKSRDRLRAVAAENQLIWKYLSNVERHEFFMVFL